MTPPDRCPKCGGPWIIRHDNGSYFERMTDIGPKFTMDKGNAQIFDTDIEACRMTLLHWAFSDTKVEVNS